MIIDEAIKKYKTLTWTCLLHCKIIQREIIKKITLERVMGLAKNKGQ